MDTSRGRKNGKTNFHPVLSIEPDPETGSPVHKHQAMTKASSICASSGHWCFQLADHFESWPSEPLAQLGIQARLGGYADQYALKVSIATW